MSPKQLMDLRIMLSHLLIENDRLLSALKQVPGFRFCAKKLETSLLLADYREWFRVQAGVGKDYSG